MNYKIYILTFELNGQTPYYKIGLTKQDILKRIADLNTGIPFVLYPVYVSQLTSQKNAFRLERILHTAYRESRVINEWFVLTEDDIEHVKSWIDKAILRHNKLERNRYAIV